MAGMARALIVFGLLCVLGGVALWIAPKVPWIGRLPGDLIVERGHFKVYLPLTTCVLLSVLLTLVAWIMQRFR